MLVVIRRVSIGTNGTIGTNQGRGEETRSVFNLTFQSQIVIFEIAFISTVSTTSTLAIHDAGISTVNKLGMCFTISCNYLFGTTKT